MLLQYRLLPLLCGLLLAGSSETHATGWTPEDGGLWSSSCACSSKADTPGSLPSELSEELIRLVVRRVPEHAAPDEPFRFELAEALPALQFDAPLTFSLAADLVLHASWGPPRRWPPRSADAPDGGHREDKRPVMQMPPIMNPHSPAFEKGRRGGIAAGHPPDPLPPPEALPLASAVPTMSPPAIPTHVSARFSRDPVLPTLAHAVTFASLNERIEAGNPLFLVDVRSEAAYARFSIPGSLNIPLFTVKTKGFLKAKPVILIDGGARPRQLNAACEQLHAVGFTAKFLFGGLHAWATAGGELQGDLFAQQTLSRIAPETLFVEYDPALWVLIDVAQDSPASPLFPDSLSVPFDPAEPCRFLTQLRHTLDERTDLLMLLYTQSGQGYEAIEHALRDTGLPPIFFLEGGAQSYRRVVAQQDAFKDGPQEISTRCDPCSR
jgi:rhodanese-related sulfurtransferase